MKQKKEAGYTLVLVLLTISLIFIFSLTLISNVLNSAAQNKKTEEITQKKYLYEMAKTHFITYVESEMQKINDTDVTDELDNTEFFDILIPKLDSYNKFKITTDTNDTPDEERDVTIQINKPIILPKDSNTLILTTIITIDNFKPIEEKISLTLEK